ncbi:MAG: hypothetical protein E6Q40_02140 [Cupriavidus sp.]|nr:MAG: hypothetical protein E6Q40_02140 [Cupriavidus sp.]
MAHPYFHAISSSRKFGGDASDYQFLHDWFDATKAHYPQFRHRLLRHSREGIRLALAIFGNVLETRDGLVAIQDVCEQHILEDCGRMPSVHDWLAGFSPAAWMGTIHPVSTAEQNTASARRYGGVAEDYHRLHSFFDTFESEDWNCLPLFALRHHSEALFLAEQFFKAPTLTNSNGRKVPIRALGEQHMILHFGRVPVPADWLRCVNIQPWMRQVGDPHAGQGEGREGDQGCDAGRLHRRG